MKTSKKAFKRFLKLCLYSGIFTVFSFVSFSVLFYFINPEIEIFTRFLKDGALYNWFAYNVFDLRSLSLLIGFALLSAVLSTIGYATAILAKVVHDKAVETIKSCLDA
jgi:hypothetical protein